MDESLIIDVVIVSFCGGLFLLYHLYFWCLLPFCRPGASTLKFNLEIRRRYMMKIQTNNGQELLGVQAMRNLIMGSSLMATLSFIITVGFLTFASGNSCDTTSFFCIKVLVLAVCFAVAGLLFIWATRAMVHASILISLRPSDFEEKQDPAKDPKKVEELEEGNSKHTDTSSDEHGSDVELGTKSSKIELRKQQREEKKKRKKQKIYAKLTKSAGRFIAHFTLYFHLGMRLYYLVVPLMLWLLTPWAMLGGTFAMMGVMFFHDHETSLPSINHVMHAVHL